jgi:hypothetical protein
MTDTTATWGQSVLSYLKTTASTHLVIIGLGVGGFIAVRAYKSEHDARLIADATVKTAQTAIVGLQAQQATVAKQATAQVIVLKQEAAAVTTPAQAVAALEAPKADVEAVVAPLDVQALPDAPGRVSVAALPLSQEVNTCAVNSVNLGSCTATLDLQKQIDTEKDVQITALKKKPGFWATLKRDAITVGIGIGVGYALHK